MSNAPTQGLKISALFGGIVLETCVSGEWCVGSQVGGTGDGCGRVLHLAAWEIAGRFSPGRAVGNFGSYYGNGRFRNRVWGRKGGIAGWGRSCWVLLLAGVVGDHSGAVGAVGGYPVGCASLWGLVTPAGSGRGNGRVRLRVGSLS